MFGPSLIGHLPHPIVVFFVLVILYPLSLLSCKKMSGNEGGAKKVEMERE